ncbi:abortive infection system antitoxin AbiGi family protein [Legionella feeleii]|nr:abortive infection system antitoxin AbiGi family protein [Legionella feeleii]
MDMPPLPPYDPSVTWKDYEIDTPAFQLTALDKADMSPYLIHMTGREEILGILSGVENNKGQIKASAPIEAKSEWYKSKVVCFSESPLFAIDAFRYIKFRRWRNDHLFGIGFSKEKLVEKNVRPVFYMDNVLVGAVNYLHEFLNAPDSDVGEMEETFKGFIDKVIPLMHPLGETEAKQGFTWEREWRYSVSGNFDFDYSDIEIVCCPKNEKDKITDVLGEFKDKIIFVESWDQYDDIRSFLKSRKQVWENKSYESGEINNLDILKTDLMKELHKLSAYQQYIQKLQTELMDIQEHKQFLEDKIKIIDETKS